jgi:TolB-like protein/Tfp pilus assembly protein PilF
VLDFDSAKVFMGTIRQGMIRFEMFEVDMRAGELRKRGVRVKLQEQPLQLLQVLLEHRSEVVTREELQRCLWPSDTFVDFEHGLYNAIKRLREALGDSAERPRFIETISKRGYRFIGVVEESGDVAPAPADFAEAESIAVLPFVNMSADPESEYFADGITEEIINVLAHIEHLRVAARSSTFSFKGKHIDRNIIGQRLNVRIVLTGSVRRAGSNLRITVQLVNVADGYHIWSERYDREMIEIFEIQDEIARSVADRLKLTLAADRHHAKPSTTNIEAYQLYLKGRALLYKRGAGILRSLECCQRAVALDPEYALAWAGLADSYTTLGYYGAALPEESMPKSMEAARRAVAFGPSLAEAHNALAMASLMGKWDKATAEREFLCALHLNPAYVQARDWYALFYLQQAAGRLEDGVAQAKLAVECDPLSAYANTIFGLTCVYAGKLEEAARVLQRAVELDPESYLSRWCLLAGLHVMGKFDEAIAVGELALAMSGRQAWAIASLATVLADCGKPADAEALYAELMARTRRGYMQPCQLAIAAAAAGNSDDAIRHAREALEIRDPMAPAFFSCRWPQSARLRAYLSGQNFASMIWD